MYFEFMTTIQVFSFLMNLFTQQHEAIVDSPEKDLLHNTLTPPASLPVVPEVEMPSTTMDTVSVEIVNAQPSSMPEASVQAPAQQITPSFAGILSAEHVEKFFADDADINALFSELGNTSDLSPINLDPVEGLPTNVETDPIRSEADELLSLLSGSHRSSPHSARSSTV